MKLMTFDMVTSESIPSRLEALVKLVQAKRPEFLALQNVTNDTIKKVSGLLSQYKVIHPPYKFENRKKPTVALFSTYPSEDSKTVPYTDTESSRVLQEGYYVMYDKQKQPFVICVATTCLEVGLKVSELREKQINQACHNMDSYEDAFIIGDFSLDSDIDGELTLRGGWADAWLEIPGNSDSTGYTYNPDKNPLIKDDPFGPGRPDRIFFKTRHFKLDSVEVVGMEPFQVTQGPAVTISTHYGLMAQFSPLDTPNPRCEPVPKAVTFKRTEWSVQFQQSKQIQKQQPIN